jgi:YD repeat-containing protein
MKKMRKAIAIMMIACPLVIDAQQMSIHSPTAANLGLYGEIPVSYYTGTPHISIPLYEIKGKNLTVPVELSYHPAGIRPEIHPGPTGLGWSLRAGGVISRTIRGDIFDENEWKNYLGLINGYLRHANSWIAGDNWKNRTKDLTKQDCNNCRSDVQSFGFDYEPDEFSFSFLNISGKFYFDHTGQIQVQCDNPVKVVFNNEFVQPWNSGIALAHYNEKVQRAFKSFTIIDEQGTQYSFGGAVNAIEFSEPVGYLGDLLHATSWFLTQIKSADGADVITFEYERGPFVSQLYRASHFYSESGAYERESGGYNDVLDGTLISPVYLRRITGSGGEEITLAYTQSNDLKYASNDYIILRGSVGMSINGYRLLEMTSAIPRFQPSAPSNKYDRIQWLKLDTICVKGKQNESVRQVNFVYNNSSSERLFLDSLKIYGANELTPPMKYAFLYRNKNRLPATYLSCITDHWGFNNGKPYLSNGFNPQFKLPNANYTDSGVLSEIRYPTGGTAQFEYELHDYAQVVDAKDRSNIISQSGTASGLRIKKIITDHLTGNIVTRSFFYKKTPASSVSSGILNALPQYTSAINGRDCCDNRPFSILRTYSMPIIPLTKDNEGLYIGYTYVCEQVSGGGYTQYQYTSHDNGHSDVLLSGGLWNRDIFPSNPHCSRYFERGRLKKETSYNSEEQAVAVKETVWERYGSEGEDNPRALFFEGFDIGYDYCSTAAYLHYCYKFLPSQKTETVYDVNGQNPVTTRITYGYNSYNQKNKIEFTDSDGSIRKQEIKYPADFQTSPYLAMVTGHILSPVVESSVFRNTSLIEKTGSDYSLQHDIFYAPDNSKYQKGSGNTEIRETYLYDIKGNMREITRNDADKTVYLWGYNGRYLIAEIHNAAYSQVTAIISAATLNVISAEAEPSTSDWNAINGLRASLPDALVTTYKYKPLVGITEKIDPRAVKTVYEYDAFGRLQTVKDHNGNYSICLELARIDGQK